MTFDLDVWGVTTSRQPGTVSRPGPAVPGWQLTDQFVSRCRITVGTTTGSGNVWTVQHPGPVRAPGGH